MEVENLTKQEMFDAMYKLIEEQRRNIKVALEEQRKSTSKALLDQ